MNETGTTRDELTPMNRDGELRTMARTALVGDKKLSAENIMKKLQNKLLAIVLATTAGGALALVSTSRAFDWPLAGQKNAKASVPVVVNEAPLARDTKFTTKTVKNPFGPDMSPFSSDPFLRRFFGDPNDEGDGRSRKRSHKERSLG